MVLVCLPEIGMMVDKDNLSFGQRSWRYSFLLNDGIVEKTFIEDGFGDNIGDDPFEVSDDHGFRLYHQRKSS